MPKIIPRPEFARSVFQDHDFRIIVEAATGTEWMRLNSTKALGKRNLMFGLDLLIPEKYYTMIEKCLLYLGEFFVVKRL